MANPSIGGGPGPAGFYSPARSRDQYAAMRARAEVSEVIAGYGDVALSHFAEQMADLDPERRRALQRLARRH